MTFTIGCYFLRSAQPFSNEKKTGQYADHFMEEQLRLAKAVFLFVDENRTVYPKKTGYTSIPIFHYARMVVDN